MRNEKMQWGILCAALCMVLGISIQAFAQDDSGGRAAHILELTNRDRVAQGLQPLRWNASLATAAQAHAERMASERFLSHEYPGEESLGRRAEGAGAHFQAIAENIARGYSDSAIEVEWMNSVAHRQNILDPQMNSIGVGVAERGGTLFAVEDFAHAAELLPPAEIERKIGALLRRDGIDPTAPREAAAQACMSNSGYPRGGTGKLVIRFDTPNLDELPRGVEGPLRNGEYHRASVAACGGGREGSFTTYRVAIVLY
jgi:hypothetical protein